MSFEEGAEPTWYLGDVVASSAENISVRFFEDDAGLQSTYTVPPSMDDAPLVTGVRTKSDRTTDARADAIDLGGEAEGKIHRVDPKFPS